MGVGFQRGFDTMFNKWGISTQVEHLKETTHKTKSNINTPMYFVVKTFKEKNNP